jgi:hypothetical protein
MIETEDIMTMEKLKMITSPTNSEIIEIFEMYKKYIDPEIQRYNLNCNCENNIVNLYNKLIKWYLTSS